MGKITNFHDLKDQDRISQKFDYDDPKFSRIFLLVNRTDSDRSNYKF